MAKMTKKGRDFVSDEISHLMREGPSKGPQKDKIMPQKQAVAVALDVARRKGFKSPPSPKDESTSGASVFDKLLSGKPESVFDSIIENDEENEEEEKEEKEGCNGEEEKEESSSAFDALIQESLGSLFDEFVDKGVDETQAGWDDRVARTLNLTETLVEIRNSVKGK